MRPEPRPTENRPERASDLAWHVLARELAQTVLRLGELLQLQAPGLANAIRQLQAALDSQPDVRRALFLLAALNAELAQLRPPRPGLYGRLLEKIRRRPRPALPPATPTALVPGAVRASLLELLDHLQVPASNERQLSHLQRELLRDVRLKELPRLLEEFAGLLGADERQLADEGEDSLAQLLFQQRLQQEFAQWQRYQIPVSVVVAQVDELAAIQDRLGPRAVARILRRTERLLRSQLRDSDYLIRLPQQQYAILMPQTSLLQATHAADKLREAVAQRPLRLGRETVEFTLSCGVSGFGGGRDSPPELLRRATAALTEAEDAGGNQVVAGRALRAH